MDLYVAGSAVGLLRREPSFHDSIIAGEFRCACLHTLKIQLERLRVRKKYWRHKQENADRKR